MKTSTMFIIASILVTLTCLTAFNYKLKEQYKSGSYKDRFRGMEFTPLASIEKLNLQAANRIAFIVEKGEKEGVWIRKSIQNEVSFGADNGVLNFDLSDKGKQENFHARNGDVIILTKNIAEIQALPYFKDQTAAIQPVYYYSETVISGYQLDQLAVKSGKGIAVHIHRMQMGKLTADIGDQKDGGSELTLSSDTKIDTAVLNLPGKSRLTLLDPKIVKTVYNVSDSATVLLNGNALGAMKR